MVFFYENKGRRRGKARQTKPPPCPLLEKLPREIRDQIWSDLVQSGNTFRVVAVSGSRCGRIYGGMRCEEAWQALMCLSETCHQVRKEATSAFGRDNLFEILAKDSLVQTPYERGSVVKRVIRPGICGSHDALPFPVHVVESMRHITLTTERIMASYKINGEMLRAVCTLKLENNQTPVVEFLQPVRLRESPLDYNRQADIWRTDFTAEHATLIQEFHKSTPNAIAQLLKTRSWGLWTLHEIIGLAQGMGIPVDDLCQSPWPHNTELPIREALKDSSRNRYGTYPETYNVLGRKALTRWYRSAARMLLPDECALE